MDKNLIILTNVVSKILADKCINISTEKILDVLMKNKDIWNKSMCNPSQMMETIIDLFKDTK